MSAIKCPSCNLKFTPEYEYLEFGHNEVECHFCYKEVCFDISVSIPWLKDELSPITKEQIELALKDSEHSANELNKKLDSTFGLKNLDPGLILRSDVKK